MRFGEVFVLAVMVGLTGCASDYCDNQLEKSEQDVMVLHEQLTLERAGEHSEFESDSHTYDWLDEAELKIRDASKGTGNLQLYVDDITLVFPIPLAVGTHTIDGPPSSGWIAPSSSIDGVRGGYRPSSGGPEETYGTATGSVEVLSTTPLAFEFTISGTVGSGADFEASGTVDAESDRMEDPEFQCND